MSEDSRILTTLGKLERPVGYSFGCFIGGSPKIGDRFPIKDWTDRVYAMGEVTLADEHGNCRVEIIQVW